MVALGGAGLECRPGILGRDEYLHLCSCLHACTCICVFCAWVWLSVGAVEFVWWFVSLGELVS